jgi:HD-like signal output (HDOD) protein
MDFETIVDKIGAHAEIPIVGPVVGEIMRLVSDPGSDFRKVAKVISKDPSLTARVLRVANSSYYGLRGEVASVEKAVGLLGMLEVRNIALSVSVISDFTARFGDSGFNWNRFWEHSSGCALISQVFARLLGLPTEGEEYAAGLLHDVGKILLGHHFPEEFARVLELAATEGLTMEKAERQVFGVEHAQIGEWLASKWSFPAAIRSAVAWHHLPEEAKEGRIVAAVVHFADLLTKVKCIGFGGDFVAVCLADDPAWKLLAEFTGRLEAMDVELFVFRLDREVDAARELLQTARAA